MRILKNLHPIARKEHKCMFCNGIIEKGEKYDRQTNVESIKVYEWVSHHKCSTVASCLDMYDDVEDEGLTAEDFQENLKEYVFNNHSDQSKNEVVPEWKTKTYEELVDKIYDEIQKKESL